MCPDTPAEISARIEAEISQAPTNQLASYPELAANLVSPRKARAINRVVKSGEISDSIVEVWVVFEERLDREVGYGIFFDAEVCEFGILSPGKHDPYPVIIGFYGSFVEAIQSL